MLSSTASLANRQLLNYEAYSTAQHTARVTWVMLAGRSSATLNQRVQSMAPALCNTLPIMGTPCCWHVHSHEYDHNAPVPALPSRVVLVVLVVLTSSVLHPASSDAAVDVL